MIQTHCTPFVQGLLPLCATIQKHDGLLPYGALRLANPRITRLLAPHRQLRLARAREGEATLLDADLRHWLEYRDPQLTLLGFLDDATRKVPVAEFFLTEIRMAGNRAPAHRILRAVAGSAEMIGGMPASLVCERA
jgi:hypothetical protein